MLNLEKKFLKIASEVLELKTKKPLNLNLKLDEVSDWDSLKNLQFVVFLEKEFKIKFDENELSSFTSLNKIFNILKGKQKHYKIVNKKKIILSFFKKKNIRSNINLFEYGFLDSLLVLNFIAFLEKKFKKKIPNSMINMKNFENINSIENLLKKINVR